MDKFLIPNSPPALLRNAKRAGKFVFLGTPRFAEIVLEKLIEGGMPPALVITNPDRPFGRKKIVTPPPVKQRIMNYESGIREKIKILQPEQLDPSLFLIPDSKFDFAILASYGKIIPKEIIDLFPKGIIVVHPSLLPKYRGATPIQSVLLSGDATTGITLLLMDEKVDHGPILAKRELNKELGMMNYETLHNALADLSATLLLEIVPKYLAGEITPQEQNHAEATFTKKFQTENGFVEWNDLKEAEVQGGEKAIMIDRMIRALNPDPGVYTLRENKRIKLLEAELSEGKLKLAKIQEEGKKPKIIEARPR